jgi:hypothetical protein
MAQGGDTAARAFAAMMTMRRLRDGTSFYTDEHGRARMNTDKATALQ